MTKTLEYRREIDGLRALAIVPVILFHANFEAFSGGFVGVDVFFVISGYLITSIILTQNEAGVFSLANFYERRARRILPTLFVVMTVCILVSWVLLIPGYMKDFARSLVAVSLFSSNILFWRESGYFDTAAELKPLLHTWSLAVEEQYYVLFPLFLLIMWRFAKRWTVAVLAVIAAISFGLAELNAVKKPAASFFLLPTRGWEIAIGALVAFYVVRNPGQRIQKAVQEMGGILGLILIVYAIFFYSKEIPFPGAYALAPTLGAALIILCATSSTIVGRVLSTKVLVNVGLISYGAYLWHQPIFVFARHSSVDTESIIAKIALSLVTIFLAYVSRRYIEFPFRNNVISKRRFFALVALFTSLFLFTGIVGSTHGFKNRYDHSLHPFLDTFDQDLQADYVQRGYLLHAQAKNNWDESGNPKILIIGDSYSQDLFNAISEIGFISRLDVVVRYVPVRCGALFLEKRDIIRMVGKADLGFCSTELALEEDTWLMEKVRTADHILLASAWKEKHAEAINQSLSRLSLYTQAKILVFGRKDLPKLERAYLKYSKEERVALIVDLTRVTSIQKKMLNIVDREIFVDIQSLICESGEANYTNCHLFDKNGMPKSYDGGHLTKYGAAFYGHAIEDVMNCRFFNNCEIISRKRD